MYQRFVKKTLKKPAPNRTQQETAAVVVESHGPTSSTLETSVFVDPAVPLQKFSKIKGTIPELSEFLLTFCDPVFEGLVLSQQAQQNYTRNECSFPPRPPANTGPYNYWRDTNHYGPGYS